MGLVHQSGFEQPTNELIALPSQSYVRLISQLQDSPSSFQFFYDTQRQLFLLAEQIYRKN